MEEQKNTEDNIQNEVVITEVKEIITASKEDKVPGRPVNPESKRQQRINHLETLRANGELKLGRPVKGDSKRQQELAEKAARAASGEPVKKGRPKMSEEAKQAARNKREADMKAALARKAEVTIVVTAEPAPPTTEEPIIAETETAVVSETPTVSMENNIVSIEIPAVEEKAPKARSKKTAPKE
jgi:hypothetical protein